LLSDFQAPTGACPVFAQFNPSNILPALVIPIVGLTIITIIEDTTTTTRSRPDRTGGVLLASLPA
jgi:hypothetical protein